MFDWKISDLAASPGWLHWQQIMVPTDGDTLYRNSFKNQRGPMAVLASNTWPFSGSYSSGLLQERFQKLLGLFEPVFSLRVIPELAFFRMPEPVGIGGNA